MHFTVLQRRVLLRNKLSSKWSYFPLLKEFYYVPLSEICWQCGSWGCSASLLWLKQILAQATANTPRVHLMPRWLLAFTVWRWPISAQFAIANIWPFFNFPCRGDYLMVTFRANLQWSLNSCSWINSKRHKLMLSWRQMNCMCIVLHTSKMCQKMVSITSDPNSCFSGMESK